MLVTDRADGDARPPVRSSSRRTAPGAPAAGAGATPAWTLVRQVHGDHVVVVTAPSGPLAVDADAIVTMAPLTPLAVLGADCALLGLASAEGPIAAVHAGWRGALGGVVERAVDAMRALGAVEISAVLGPCIHAECYEFGEGDLDVVAASFGDVVRSATASGRPSLDLPKVVERSLARAGVPAPREIGACTSCDRRWYSHRARAETGRHALVISRGQAGEVA